MRFTRTSVASVEKAPKRNRGTIRKHRAGYQVRVSAGTDPVTGERLRLQGTVTTMREAEKLRTKLLGEADTFRSARTVLTVSLTQPAALLVAASACSRVFQVLRETKAALAVLATP
jgi:hypothetical protein